MEYLVEPTKTDRWIWKMDYCVRNNMPPAQEWAWNIADDEYNKQENK